MWPILGSIIPFRDVFVIGAYHGLSKPANSNDFFNDFVSEVKELSQSGVNIKGKILNLSI